MIALGLGLWAALSPSRLGRAGAAALGVTGLGTFLDGIFRLDCRSIDAGCSNDSWHSHAHKIESGFTAGVTFLALVLLAIAFRRITEWRDTWLPTIAAVPAVVVANIVFSPVGSGAATRAGTVVVFLAIAFIAFRLVQKGMRTGPDAMAAPSRAR